MKSNRIVAIDVFRALTMLLMIFVNDLWTLSDVPSWLGHTSANEDGMGLADWVFPGFLFIVGLSIPFAIQSRKEKGARKHQIFMHIVKRSLALIVMGFYMVNLQYINDDLIPFSKYIWQFLMALAIVLVWNIYQGNKAFNKVPDWIMQVAGIAILVFLAVVFTGGTQDAPIWMKPHWWGILGLIGWAYFLCATLYLLIGERVLAMGAIFLILMALNTLEFMDLGGIKIKLVVGASNHASIMGGVIVSLLYRKYNRLGRIPQFILSLSIFGILAIVFGFITRPEWGISKIRATPSWTSICLGISIFSFIGIYILTDILKKTSWAKIVGPAGRSTLTCYLVPHFYYSIMMLVGIFLPEFLKTGFVGIVKSLMFAFLIVFITGLLEKVNIRLKV